MSTVTLQCNKMARADPSSPGTNYPSTALAAQELTGENDFFVGFASLANDYRYKQIRSIALRFFFAPGSAAGNTLVLDYRAMTKAWTEADITWNSANLIYRPAGRTGTKVLSYLEAQWLSCALDVQTPNVWTRIRAYGVWIVNDALNATDYLHTINSTNKPELVFDFYDANAYIRPINCAPASGYAPNEAENLFSWGTEKVGVCHGVLSVAGSKFRWRVNSSAAYTEVDCGTALSYAMPANTVTTDSFQWQAVINDNGGTTTASEWMTLTTVEAASSAAVIAPVNTVVDGAKDIVLSWQHIISTGTVPTGYELQSSADGVTYTQLAIDDDSAATTYTVPADTLAAGTLYWRVRTYNTDGVAGAWSDAAKISIVAAPALPTLAITDMSPRFSIRCGGVGQQACQIRIDGELHSHRFGGAATYSYDDYLSDGGHTVGVRIQNSLGLWSEWAEAALNIANSAGAAIQLSAVRLSGARALLSWSSLGAYSKFIIYRNGKRLTETTEQKWTDPYPIGLCSYTVRGVIADSGSYGTSEAAELQCTPEVLTVTDAVTLAAVELRYSESQIRTTTISRQRLVEYRHYAGSALPDADMGEGRERYYNLACAFDREDAAKAAEFEAMAGRLVCIRDSDGNKLFGILDSVSINSNIFYRAYTAGVREIRHEEG